MRWLAVVGLLGGCAPFTVEHQADAAFRTALGAQLGGDEARAELEYRRVLALGVESAPALNNLAVIAVHRHQYIAARHLLARAVAADERDLVPLTNYGVISYYLADLDEARRTLEEARALRTANLRRIPSLGRSGWEEAAYARDTAALEDTAVKYLDRIAAVGARGVAAAPLGELVAALSVRQE